ncbi:FecCD family ABC transporter permease [Rothia terrae]|uniref:Iron chelate uptake ABC transporter family permease subunit n=1 Tax=Rothia terrae TaxID=396015 RepID=A0A7H2BF66_9MICC|nr:iron chelate uptake ABC transporter family permease subunit [Rothia terrae]QNV38312.1 iron chelate uptake ABC transporter family permease subunit [Rothia terrae]
MNKAQVSAFVENPPRDVWLRAGSRSVLIRRRTAVITAVLLLSVVATGLWALGVGGSSLNHFKVAEVLMGGGTPGQRMILVQWRAPRILAAVVVGGALGISGAIFQTLTRNPLGSPDLIGFTMGAQTGILVAVIVAGASLASVTSFALVGGLLAGAIVYALSFKGGFGGLRLILGGIAVSSMLGSFNRWLIVQADSDTAYGALKAVTGTFASVGWDTAGWSLAGIALISLLALGFSQSLETLSLGHELGTTLGLPMQRIQALMVLTGVALVALATVVAGPISFIALLAPHIARSLCRSYVAPLVASALTGSLLLLAADVLGQAVLESLPVGIVTSALGGLYFLALLIAETRKKL